MLQQGRSLWCLTAIAGIAIIAMNWRWNSPLPLNIDSFKSRATEQIVASGSAAAQTRDADVFLFLSPHCPISNSYLPLLNRLSDEFSSPNLRFVGVIPATAIDGNDVDDFRHAFGLKFPLLVDRNHQISETLRATHTPQVIVRLGSQTVYSGRIDDRFADLGKARNSATHHDLEDVLTLLKNGNSISPHSTPLTGCLIERPASLHSDNSVRKINHENGLTFNRDVAPIIFEHCSRCHRPGEAAPFSLLTIDDMRAHASQIDVVVGRRLMPPWKPEPGFAEFANEHRISSQEQAVLHRWIASDQTEGEPDDLPLTPIFPSGWQLGNPDLELIMPEPFLVPADGPDIYQHFVIPTGLTEDRLVNAVEFRPGAPEVVHHTITYFDTTGRGRELDAEDSQPGYSRLGSPGFAVSGSLGGWGPGGQARRLPAGMGRPLAKDSDLIVQIHYHPIGRSLSDQSRIGLYFAPRSATHQTTEIMVADVDLSIPAGATRHHHHAENELPVDTILFDATPHMHVLGKEIKAVAYLPDGSTVPLIWIREWDFYWQDSYVYAAPVTLPKGTRITLDCWFDNSSENPLNPNSPPRDVHWGDFSTDEMAICYFQVTTRTWDDYVKLNRHSTKYFADLWQRYQDRSHDAANNSIAVPSGSTESEMP